MATAFTPNSKAVPAHLKLTPNQSSSTSPLIRAATHTPKSPLKRSLTDTREALGLNLKRMIGTTTSSPSGLASHPPTGSIAFCTGAAVCVVKVDENLQIQSRYFLRARPSAGAQATNTGSSSVPSTPEANISGSRIRSSITARDSGIGFSPIREFESPGKGEDGKNWSVRDRVKAATTVSFSPDGRYIAVGETGHNPRVLIYNVAGVDPSCSDLVPFAILTEHTYGVKCVAFSPCSQYLASIGQINDGCLYIWSMPTAKGAPVKLHSSNRCTNLVYDMAWIGKGLITVGLRHVKIWKMEEEPIAPSPQANSSKSLHSIFEKFSHGKTKQPIRPQGPNVLNGRNALLGPLLEEVFISVTAIADDRAIISTEKGDICIIDDGLQRVAKVASADTGVTCLAVDVQRKYAWVAGRHGSIRTLKLQDIANPLTPPESPSSRSGSPILPLGCKPANVIAMVNLGQNLFLIDSNRSIKVISLKYHEGLPTPDSVAYEFPAHKSAVNGVRLMPPSAYIQADFFTWSACGTILFWDNDGNYQNEVLVELEQPRDIEEDIRNELKVVELSDNGELIVTGDRFGVLRIHKTSDRSCCYVVKAHAGEIMSISIYDGEKATMVSSCARDRTVQLYTKMKKPASDWTLTQTLDDHTASVTRVKFMDNGTKLLSASADRTIVVREMAVKEAGNGNVELLAFLAARVITLKATPLHMASFSDSSPLLLASTTGRQVYRFDINTGKELYNFKCSDDSGESVILDAITPGREVSFSKSRLLAGISSTDKSVRIYDMVGNLVEREWGHTEGVTDIAMFETSGPTEDGNKLTLISTGTDGTVMIWTYNTKIGDSDSIDGASMLSDTTASKAPIRKVLSKAEIMELTSRSEKGSDASSITGKTKDKENRKDGLLASDWASVSDPETTTTTKKPKPKKAETQPQPPPVPEKPPIPPRSSRLSERPKSAILNISPPKTQKANYRNSVGYIPKSGSTTSLIAKGDSTAASRAPSRSASRLTSRAASRADLHNNTDTDSNSTAGTTKRRLRLPTRSRDPSPSTSTTSSNNTKSGALPLASRRGSTNSRTTSLRTNTSHREATDATNANALAEQMTRSLGVFRRRVESSQYAMKAEVRKELEKELLATLKCIGCGPAVTPTVSVSGDENPTSPKSQMTTRALASRGGISDVGGALAEGFNGDGLGIRMDEPMMALLNTYSERLLSVIENRLGPDGAISPRPSFSSSSGGR
ncbi:Mitogen-activated protein kinase [Drechslerella dactyloides]|uniref:Mitogen-activated protein kinase n=1 Tax=Drechslerella dactyloides TaxID=74499 RepID=A0AAD6NJ55_DREDA|nr:Mitogen-activated protein kinase [Drechslerella dactyloides]